MVFGSSHGRLRVTSPLLLRLHLTRQEQLLTARAVQLLQALFERLDCHGTQSLNDLQFLALMCSMTSLREDYVYRLFDMLDLDDSGSLEFDEFYLLMCILISIKDRREKEFLFKHSGTCFSLIDVDHSGSITIDEFNQFGFLFNISHGAAKAAFKSFDMDSDKELDEDEFRMFCLICLDKQMEIERLAKLKQSFKKSMVLQKMKSGVGSMRMRGRLSDARVAPQHGGA